MVRRKKSTRRPIDDLIDAHAGLGRKHREIVVQTHMPLSAETQAIVGAYLRTLLSCKSRPADASELPYPRSTIKSALIATITTTQDANARDELISAFVHLADWQEGIGPGPHSLFDLIDGGDVTEEARRICAAGPSIRLATESSQR
jgi:hypothetical protein